MSRKNKVTQNAVSVESIKDDKRKCKSKKMIQKELEELVSKLKDQNDDHIEIVRNTKQTQSQLVQLEETNGKNKKQKMETAQNNLKNLKKRQIELEKKMKDVLGKMRGLGDEVNLEKECKGLTGVLEVVTAMTKKKKNKVGNEQVKQEEQKESDKKLDSVKIQKKDSSPLNEAHYAAATFAMPPHFSEFIKTPEKEKNPAKKHEKIITTLRNSIEALRLQSKPIPLAPVQYSHFTMPNYQPDPPSCLVKNANGIYSIRKTSEHGSAFFMNPSSSYSSNLVYENRPQRNCFGNPLQYRDREIDPYGCWKPPQASSSMFNFSKPPGF